VTDAVILLSHLISDLGGEKMIRTDLLKVIIAENDTSQRAVAKKLGMTEKTFYSKMKKGVFDSDEITEMISLLNIKNPTEIFFATKVT